jgi:hypothetical protein
VNDIGGTGNTATYYPTFVGSTGNNQTVFIDSNQSPLSFVPSTSTMYMGSLVTTDRIFINNSIWLANGGQTSSIYLGCTGQDSDPLFIQGQDNPNPAPRSVRIGYWAGQASNQMNSVAIGTKAGGFGGTATVAIGNQAGGCGSYGFSVAIGQNSGRFFLGEDSVAIGRAAAQDNQPNNTITLNATGVPLNGNTSYAFFVSPIRGVTGDDIPQYSLGYNYDTSEVTFSQIQSNPALVAGATGATGISATNTTATQKIYTVGPIRATTNSSRYLLTTAVTFRNPSTKNAVDTKLTIGRSTSTGSTSANTVNIASGFGGSTSPTILQSGNTYVVSAISSLATGDLATHNGYATDRPGATGIDYYYTLWLTSSVAQNYSDMQCDLTVLKVMP